MTKRGDIEYHKRKFKLNLSGRDPLGDYTFEVQPPNEFAFSSRFNQCLVKISKVSLSNLGDTVAGGVDAAWGTTAAPAVLAPCGAGILLRSNIATTQNAQYLEGAQQVNPKFPSVQVVIPNTGAGMPLAGAYLGAVGLGTSWMRRDGGGLEDYWAPKFWGYQDDRPIEDSGVLCGNLFSNPINFQLINPLTEARIALVSSANLANVASRSNDINIELEVLMLENPRAE